MDEYLEGYEEGYIDAKRLLEAEIQALERQVDKLNEKLTKLREIDKTHEN